MPPALSLEGIAKEETQETGERIENEKCTTSFFKVFWLRMRWAWKWDLHVFKEEKETKCIKSIHKRKEKGKNFRQKAAKWETMCSQRKMKYAEKVCRQAREERERKCLQRVAERVKMCKEKGEENKKACKQKGEKREKLCRQKDNARQQEEDANEIEPMGQ